MSNTAISLLTYLHIIGLGAWFGGQTAGIALLSPSLQSLRGNEQYLALARKMLLFVAIPGKVLTLATGLMRFIGGISHYKTQGWMHIKLTIAVFAFAASGWLIKQGLAAARGNGEVAAAGKVRAAGIIFAVAGALALFFVIFKIPGSGA